ncbi:hypothetical protein [Thalassobacillus devorans]|uniref:hypothetical protein n=1 Tax=Thalassobacillus devorans TaxID=279813 RepID=UPI000A1C85F0|nr:hypothetical protein [Thalassobacillus devorans]
MELVKYRSRQLPKRPVIHMPGKWCRTFGIYAGEEVDVIRDRRTILIEKSDPESTHNKRYVSGTNAINIPLEIINDLGMQPYQLYSLFIDTRNERFIVSLDNWDEPSRD